MKRILSIITTILVISVMFGCQEAAPEEKGDYNIAYIPYSLQMNEYTINSASDADSVLRLHQNFQSGSERTSDGITFFHISGWDYGSSDSVILYCTDGRTIQTSFENVILMYDPNIE